jgi:hypothetical protein
MWHIYVQCRERYLFGHKISLHDLRHGAERTGSLDISDALGTTLSLYSK